MTVPPKPAGMIDCAEWCHHCAEWFIPSDSGECLWCIDERRGREKPKPRQVGKPRRFFWEEAERLAAAGLPHREIAARLGVSRSAVTRALRELREAA